MSLRPDAWPHDKRTLNRLSPERQAGNRVQLGMEVESAEDRVTLRAAAPAEGYLQMSRQSDEALEVLRGVWSAQGQTSADLDEGLDNPKSCKRMADVGFDGLAGPDTDLSSAWRSRLQREGKLNPDAGSVRDLVLGPAEARR